MKKKIILACASFIIGVVLVGCTTGNNTEGANSSDNDAQTVHLMEENEVLLYEYTRYTRYCKY
ncbi:hypothetical protein HRD57_12840 [Tetragenococcus halophilus]|nr:hypothetical protein [Tetragenococcus halophilus]